MDQEESLLAYVLRRLRETRGRWPDAADGSGVPISTVRKIAQGRISDPAFSKVDALSTYFRRLDSYLADTAAASVPRGGS